MVEKTFNVGWSKGIPFSEQTGIQSVGLIGGAKLDRIILNGIAFGGPGGYESHPAIALQPGEYFDRIEVYHGEVIDALFFYTNLGRKTYGGTAIITDPNLQYVNIRFNQLYGISGQISQNASNGQPHLVCNLRIRVNTV
ncbi:MAG: hypothetical protein KK482_27415 [Sinorhizobium meliloti]|nr:hypothetical protein [Sinorhizobium meliloti]